MKITEAMMKKGKGIPQVFTKSGSEAKSNKSGGKMSMKKSTKKMTPPKGY